MALQTLDAALGEKAGDVQTALISVDPERDTPEALRTYVANEAFPAGLVGLTGTAEQVDAVADSFKILRQRRRDEGSALGYTIDHSSYFYLMDRNWRTAAVFPSEMAPEDMAACIDRALETRG
jgi:protein SCO1/2